MLGESKAVENMTLAECKLEVSHLKRKMEKSYSTTDVERLKQLNERIKELSSTEKPQK